MRILLIWASADWSTADQSLGYQEALTAMGHQVKIFRLVRRLEFWAEALLHWSEMTKQSGAQLEQVCREASDWALIEAAYFRPDLVLITSGMGFHSNAAAMLRAHGYKVGVALSECPYDDAKHEDFIQAVDYAFANDLWSVERLAKVNPNTWYVPTAYSETRHFPQEPEGRADVLFVGTGFGERERMLRAVDWSGIDLQLFGFWGWENETIGELQPLIREPITNDEAARRYCGAKVCLNFYRDGAGYSLNPRAYELAACGAFQLAQDSVLEAHLLFGDSIAYFDDAASLGAQVRYWLLPENAERRRNMAEEALRLVQGHSYRQRVESILRHVRAEVVAMR